MVASSPRHSPPESKPTKPKIITNLIHTNHQTSLIQRIGIYTSHLTNIMSSKGSSGGLAAIAQPFVCGGSAATFASCVIHPMDLAKVYLVCCLQLQLVYFYMFVTNHISIHKSCNRFECNCLVSSIQESRYQDLAPS